ncbi:MAG TPA: DUF3667 domain-containing protein [Flavobacterium sp.]|uniref:DUF3667 domain-containing protein n=1 Tax=Flavobacterium sp. TaxID=239 RepID=UPI002DB6D98F|nr:DUF3667 domain-containing protein [Flavobacterium sp.]HEU4789751.1 DUF3667 domain-containing protein [Flavobacterium sp.]
MNITCKNCHQTFKGHYCSNCGQTAETHPINLHFLWHDIQHGLFHFDNGITYTAKQLFTRPGHSIREFIEGKRVKHFKPISLVVVLATAYIALIHLFHIDVFVKTEQNSIPNYHIDIDQLKEWMISHFAWITLAFIPLHTIGTAICFRKQGYNFIEYFVLNTYKASQKLYVAILFIPILYHFSGTPSIDKVTKTLMLIDFVLYFWTNVQFFNYLSKTKTFLLTLLTHLIFWFIVFLIAICALLIIDKV